MVSLFFYILLVLIILILFIPIQIKISYRDNAAIKVLVGGISVPLQKKEKTSESKPKVSQEEQAEKSLLAMFTWKEKLELAKLLLGSFLKYSRDKIQIANLEISIEFGTLDAAKTAVFVGSFWAALYGFLPILDQIFRVRKHEFSVTPCYNRELFRAQAEGIIKTRVMHIIFIGTVLLIQFLRYKNKKKAGKKK